MTPHHPFPPFAPYHHHHPHHHHPPHQDDDNNITLTPTNISSNPKRSKHGLYTISITNIPHDAISGDFLLSSSSSSGIGGSNDNKMQELQKLCQLERFHNEVLRRQGGSSDDAMLQFVKMEILPTLSNQNQQQQQQQQNGASSAVLLLKMAVNGVEDRDQMELVKESDFSTRGGRKQQQQRHNKDREPVDLRIVRQFIEHLRKIPLGRSHKDAKEKDSDASSPSQQHLKADFAFLKNSFLRGNHWNYHGAPPPYGFMPPPPPPHWHPHQHQPYPPQHPNQPPLQRRRHR